MNSQHSRPGSPGSSAAPSQTGPPSQDMRAKGAEAASKVANAARQASGQAKQAASSLASDATKQAKGFLNLQVGAGADMVDHVVESARAAAESLDQNAAARRPRAQRGGPRGGVLAGSARADRR